MKISKKIVMLVLFVCVQTVFLQTSEGRKIIKAPTKEIERHQRLIAFFKSINRSDEEIRSELRMKKVQDLEYRMSTWNIRLSLWSMGRKNVSRPDEHNFGCTLLHYAAYGNQKTAVNFLLKAGADTTQTDRSGKTPLYYALRQEATQVIPLLIAADIASDKTKSNPTSIQLCDSPELFVDVFRK